MRRECLVLWISANNLLAEVSNDIVKSKVCASPAAKVAPCGVFVGIWGARQAVYEVSLENPNAPAATRATGWDVLDVFFRFDPWNLYFLNDRMFCGGRIVLQIPSNCLLPGSLDGRTGRAAALATCGTCSFLRVNTINRSYPLIPQGGTEKPR